MAKLFEEANITSHDDGTFSIRLRPVQAEDESGNDGMTGVMGTEKTATAGSLDEALAKIQELAGSGAEEETETPDEGEEDMNHFLNGTQRPKKMAESEE
jgi:hypothetical protein